MNIYVPPLVEKFEQSDFRYFRYHMCGQLSFRPTLPSDTKVLSCNHGMIEQLESEYSSIFNLEISKII